MTITGERFDAARPKTPTEYLKNKFGAANMPERLLELMKLLNTEDEEDSYKQKKNQKEEDLAGLKAAKVIRKEMKSIIYDFPEFRGFDKSTLRLPQLNQYLFSTKFNPPIPNKVRDDMMNAPLSHYFIHTSLNSYFTGNLVLEKYSDEPIIDALKQGVRVIELDLMPCPEGGICVSRRMNFEKPLKLQKCLDSIKDHAFTHTSSYPVIITFKDGANPDLHSKACQMINQTFGGMVHQRDPHSLEEFPSPAQLRNKILISRRPPKQLLCANGAKEKICVQDGKKTLQDSPDVNYQSLVSFYAVEPSGMLRKALTDKVKKTQRPGWYEKEVISFTKTSFLRIRPSGKLYKSAPYKPQRAWIHGAQMIALSRQEDNKKLWLVQGMFRANGGCGYVKKPDFLLNASPSGVFYPAVDPMGKRKMLTVKVYMGDGWRVDFENTIGRWSKPKLYVMIGIAGVTHDEKIVQTKVQRKWIPVWGQDFTFPLRYHHLALLSIQVYNHDLSLPDGFCGQTCLPVPELIEGIRAVPLYDEKGKKCSSTMLLMGFTWS